MRKAILMLVAGTMLLPVAGEAQQRARGRVVQQRNDDCCYFNRFSLEPYAGAFKDAYDMSPDGSDTGYMLGARIGYSINSRSRLLANFGYTKSEDVSNPNGLATYYVYDNKWVMTTGGGEFDVVPGRTSASLGLQAGVGWRQTDLDGSVGLPLPSNRSNDRWSTIELVIPSLSARHRVTNRATVSLMAQDHIFNVLEGTAQHSPALTLGITFR